MKTSGGSEHKPVMLEDTKQLFKECVTALSILMNNTEENLSQKYMYEDLFNLSHLMRIHQKVDEAKEEEQVSFDIQDWVLIYTTLCLHCIFFSEKSFTKLQNEVFAHPELGS